MPATRASLLAPEADGGVRLGLWVAALALPVLGLVLLLAAPDADVQWEHHPSHFWLVLAAGVTSAALAFSTSAVALRRSDARLYAAPAPRAGRGGDAPPPPAPGRPTGRDGRVGRVVAPPGPAARRPHARRARHRRAARGSGGRARALRARRRALPGDGPPLGLADPPRCDERVGAPRRGERRRGLRAQLARELVGVAPADAGGVRGDRRRRPERGRRGALQRPLPRPHRRGHPGGERAVRGPGRLHLLL